MGTQSVPQLFSTLYFIRLVLHVLWVPVLKSWPAEVHAELHAPNACSDFSPGWGEPRKVAAKAVAQSPKQDSHEVSVKLQCSYSVKSMFFQCGIEHPEELAKKGRLLLVSREERGFVHAWVTGKSWKTFTSTPVLQKPLETEWYRHCRLAEVKNVFEGNEESSIAIIWFWRNIFSASLDVENSLKNPSRLIFSCLVNLAQKLRSGN